MDVARTTDQAFRDFHLANPWVYRELVRLARELVAEGHRRVGIKMLFEVLRWQVMLETHDDTSKFKLNNNYHSRYVRLIEDNEPDLRNIFETRALRCA